MKASEAALAWGISLHRVQELCKQGRIKGVSKFGKSYMIPIDAQKPEDTRRKESKRTVKETSSLPMPKKSPFLNMTDLYTRAGTVDECIERLADNPEAQVTVGEYEKIYDGSAKEPPVSVIVDGKTLTEGVDFDVTYSNNVYVSADATATVTFKGNYSGEATTTFEIIQDPATGGFDGEWVSF